ncbi:hypothetical protein ACTMU2_27705 [Cupriavidus basilensis]
MLLLTLFFRHFPKLIDAGNVCVARPPLFRVTMRPRAAEARAEAGAYASTQVSLRPSRTSCSRTASRTAAWQISRFKGLGEMSAEQLWEDHHEPRHAPLAARGAGRIRPAADRVEMMNMLMGKGEAAQRRSWLEEKGNEVEADI